MVNESVKTSKRIKSIKIVRKVQKYISMAAVVMMVLMMSSVTVFASSSTGTTSQATVSAPAGVDTTTMSQFGGIIWWVVRIVILAIGAVPAMINLVKGFADEDNRQRNQGLITLIVTAAIFAITFPIQGIIGF